MWPLHSDVRSANISSNGGDFVAARRIILSRYALPWLLELHNLDSELYGRIAFQSCFQKADDQNSDGQIQDNSAGQVRCFVYSLCRFVLY